MKFGAMSPDIKFIQIEELDESNQVVIEVRAKKKNGKIKTVAKTVDGPSDDQKPEDWLKSNITKIGLDLLF